MSSPAWQPFVKILRPEQWVKNLLLFFPAFFGQKLTEPEVWWQLILGFGAFSMMASTVYILNDYADRESDRAHPLKASRPLASGAVSVRQAFCLGLFCLVLAVLMGLITFSNWFLLLLGLYFIQNIAYSFYLKRIPILDLAVLGIGFLIRIFSGGILADVPVSEWLVIMIFLGALMVGFGKRRDELLVSEKSEGIIRKALEGYSLSFINVAMVFVSSVTAVAYLMYTLSNDVITRIGTPYVYLTSFFVILGILKYLQLTFVEGKTGQPTRLFLENRALQLIVLAWLLSFSLMLYLW